MKERKTKAGKAMYAQQLSVGMEEKRNEEGLRASERLIALYAKYVDLQDAKGVSSVFTEMGRISAANQTIARNREEIASIYTKLLGEICSSSHLVGGSVLEEVSGEELTVSFCFQAWDSYIKLCEKPDLLSFGRYTVRAVKDGGRFWKIRHLQISFSGQRRGSFTCS